MDVLKETDIVAWWVVCVPHMFSFILKLFEVHCDDYPTLSCIVMDVCAIPCHICPL